MNRVVAVVAILHLLAHSVFGCCGHQSHGVKIDAANSAVLHCCDFSGQRHFSEPHGGYDCGHHCVGKVDTGNVAQAQSDCTLGESESSRHLPHQCSHGSCQWLASRPFDTSALAALDHALVFFAPTAAPATFATAMVCVLESELRQTLALPLRLHLALGVLLI